MPHQPLICYRNLYKHMRGANTTSLVVTVDTTIHSENTVTGTPDTVTVSDTTENRVTANTNTVQGSRETFKSSENFGRTKTSKVTGPEEDYYIPEIGGTYGGDPQFAPSTDEYTVVETFSDISHYDASHTVDENGLATGGTFTFDAVQESSTTTSFDTAEGTPPNYPNLANGTTTANFTYTMATGSTYTANESGSYHDAVGADGMVDRVASGSLTSTSTTFSSGSESGTVDATGEISGGNKIGTVHQEHSASGRSESTTTTTTTYGASGEETTIATSENSNFSRTLSWDSSYDYPNTPLYNFDWEGDLSRSNRVNTPAQGVASGERNDEFHGTHSNTGGSTNHGEGETPQEPYYGSAQQPDPYTWVYDSSQTIDPTVPPPVKPVNWKSFEVEPPGVWDSFVGGLEYSGAVFFDNATQLVTLGYYDQQEFVDEMAAKNNIPPDVQTATRLLMGTSFFVGSLAAPGALLSKLGQLNKASKLARGVQTVANGTARAYNTAGNVDDVYQAGKGVVRGVAAAARGDAAGAAGAALDVGLAVGPNVGGLRGAKGKPVKPRAGDPAVAPNRLTGVIEQHHQLPREFAKRFKDAGLNIDDFIIPLDKAKHRLKPNGIHTNAGGNWNKVWDKWLKENPSAQAPEILDQLAKMRKQFGLE